MDGIKLTGARWDGDFPLAAHLGINGGVLALYLLFGLLGYTLWRVRRQQKLFDILFCQISRRLPETQTTATHFVEERFWVIGITLIDVLVVATTLVHRSHDIFGYSVDWWVISIFLRLHYLRLGSTLFLVILFLLMFYEATDRKNFVFRPFFYNTALIFISILLVSPVLVLELLIKLYLDFAEGFFIVQLLWKLLLLTVMIAISGHISINSAEAENEGLSTRQVHDHNHRENLEKSKYFMIAVILVQVIFEILITVWYMVVAYYDFGVADKRHDTRLTYRAIAESVYIALPCLIKCIIYVHGFYRIPDEHSSVQTMTMRSLPSRKTQSENPYGSVSLNPYGSVNITMNGTSGMNGFDHRMSSENPYEAWYKANSLNQPKNSVFDTSRSRRQSTEEESISNYQDYQDEIYTLSLQKIPRPPP